jgi:predicted transcriptional regulator
MVAAALSIKGTPAMRPEPAVPINKSVTPDYIVCLEDRRQLKMLKRYLRTTYDMSPDQYRQRWALPAAYPMVAPNYAKKRSKLAKAIELGTAPRRKRAKA